MSWSWQLPLRKNGLRSFFASVQHGLIERTNIENLIKGNCFRTLLGAADALRGEDVRARVVAALPQEARDLLRGVVASGWYPMSLYASVHEQIANVCGTGEAFARDIGRHATQEDLRGFARVALRFASPKQAFTAITLVGSRYYKGGSVRVAEQTSGRAHLVCENFTGSSALTWAEFSGGIEVFIEATGGEAVRIHRVNGGGSSAHAEYMIHWLAT